MEAEQSPPANPTEARFAWMRAVRALSAMGELVPLDEETNHLIFNELRMVEAATNRRQERSKSGVPGANEEGDDNAETQPEATAS